MSISDIARPTLRRPSHDDIKRVREKYRECFRHYPDLLRPQRFTEKMQWRKLFDCNPIFSIFSDKLAVRDFISSRVGSEVLSPLLWVGDKPEDIPFGALEPPYILKCTHDSGSNVLVTGRDSLNVTKTRKLLGDSLRRNYGLAMDEPGYASVPPRLIAERMLVQPDGSPPIEYKIFVFDGKVRLIHAIVVAQDRARYDAVYDLDWNWLGWRALNRRFERPLPRPERLREIIAIAERLGSGIDQVRVDTYNWAGGIRAGELTLYHLGGLVRYVPDDADFILGSWWRLPDPMVNAAARILQQTSTNAGDPG